MAATKIKLREKVQEINMFSSAEETVHNFINCIQTFLH